MKIQYIKVIANRKRGEVAELDAPTARAAIAAGYAEPYTDPEPDAGEDEHIDHGDAETGTQRRTRRR